MHNSENQIDCPNCGHDIDVNDILYRKLNASIKKEYDERLASEQTKIQNERKSVEEQQKQLQAKEQSITSQIEAGITSRINTEREAIAKEEREKAAETSASSIKLLQQELAEKTDKLKELHESKIAISRLQREKDNLKLSLEAEHEKKLTDAITLERKNIQQDEASKSEMKIKEKEHLIHSLKEQLTLAQRKAEQGSMQVQGEVQELAIEEWLRDQFPQDEIQEIKKGATGADCLHIVSNKMNPNCGTIYYESKRTKSFNANWIEKFKDDIRDKNATIGVLVTEVMPSHMERMGMHEGIWICTFQEFKGLCKVLRDTVLRVDRAVQVQENKGDKMEMLYQFLSSNEFRLQVEGIVEGFTQMQLDLDKEKRSTKTHWKKREKQIEKVLLNTNHMYGSIRGIAGNSIQSVPALDFDCTA